MKRRNKLVWACCFVTVMVCFFSAEMLAATVVNNVDFHERSIVFGTLAVVVLLLSTIGMIMWKAPWIRCTNEQPPSIREADGSLPIEI